MRWEHQIQEEGDYSLESQTLENNGRERSEAQNWSVYN